MKFCFSTSYSEAHQHYLAIAEVENGSIGLIEKVTSKNILLYFEKLRGLRFLSPQ